jgi:lipoic acid synthetase
MKTEATEPGRARGWAPQGKDTGVVRSKGTARVPILEGEALPLAARKPEWLKVRSPGGPNYLRLKQLMRHQRLHSVCEEAGCPNIGECWEAGTATFLILGDVCTRACKYCAIAHGLPTELDWDEPRRVAEAAEALALEHIVVTSVNRDELPDGGASIFAETIRLCRERRPSMTVEVLIPDFKGDEDALRCVVDARPDILNHNLETVERLHPWARPGGRYWRSISLLGAAKRMDPGMLTKSGIILGLGEARDEIRAAMADLRQASVDILTLGQYLRPSVHHAPVARWVTPREFADWKLVGERELGFRHVESGPLVRSSYHAEKQARRVQPGGVGAIGEIMEADVRAPAEPDTVSLAAAARLVQIQPLRRAAAS